MEGLCPIDYNCTEDSFIDLNDNAFLQLLALPDGNPQDRKLTLIWSWVVGIFPLGGMLGGLCTGFVADRFGR